MGGMAGVVGYISACVSLLNTICMSAELKISAAAFSIGMLFIFNIVGFLRIWDRGFEAPAAHWEPSIRSINQRNSGMGLVYSRKVMPRLVSSLIGVWPRFYHE